MIYRRGLQFVVLCGVIISPSGSRRDALSTASCAVNWKHHLWLTTVRRYSSKHMVGTCYFVCRKSISVSHYTNSQWRVADIEPTRRLRRPLGRGAYLFELILLIVCMLTMSPMLSTFGVASADVAGCPGGRSVGAVTYLFDCRAYELVSPAYKEGSPVEIQGVSQDGSRMLAISYGSFSDPEDVTPIGAEYSIARGSEGWGTTSLDAPFSEFSLYSTVGLSPDFQSTLVFAGTSAQSFEEEAYLGLPDGLLAPVGPRKPPAGAKFALTFIGASENLRRVLFFLASRRANSEEESSLWPGDKTADGRLPSLYEYEYAGEEAKEPRLVGITNMGVPKSVEEGHLVSDCGTVLGSMPAFGGDTYNAVSASGATVFFTAAACGSGPPVDEVYVRFAGTPAIPAHTVAISEPITSDCRECKTEISNRAEAQFRGASVDGSKVFFTTEQHLLPSATGTGPYLYEYDFNGPEGKKVTLVSGGDAAGPRVRGVARVSEDGSHVYFVAEGVLSGENGEHKSPVEDRDNLYFFERDAAHPQGRIAFVAKLSEEDVADWSPRDERPVQATPDGRFLVFQSTADLTSDQGDMEEAGQVFEYDADTEALVRVSRGQGGYNEDGNSREYSATIPVQRYEREVVGGLGRFTHLAISADGSRVFFSSMDALVKQALSGVTSVYEYHDGQVGLISDGHDTGMPEGRPAVELIGTDESGQDVFFTTVDRLVPQDTDDQVDVYDARIEGGFAPPSAPAPCLDDSCQNALASSPLLLVPETSSVVGEAVSLASRQKMMPKKKKAGKRKAKGRTIRNRRTRRSGHRINKPATKKG